MAKLKPTSGREWRRPREEGYALTLPSGNTAIIRPVALDVMLQQGEIPDVLTPIAASTLWSEVEVDGDKDPALGLRMIGLFDIVARAAFVEPRVVDDPQDDDEIAPSDLSLEDKGAVFQLAIQPARVLAKFCEQQAAGVGPVPAGKNDQQPAE